MSTIQSAIRELEAERDRINAALNALYGIGKSGRGRPRGGRRHLSPAARQRIAAAQKARWAKWKAGKKK